MNEQDNTGGVTLKTALEAARKDMTQDAYFTLSEDRETVTPENIAGLVDYPALFRAMVSNRELRPALSPAMSTGRAMNDFLTCTVEEFAERYTIEPGPVNPKTGKPFGSDTKAYLEWAAKLTKTPVTPEEHAMFGNMAKAYSGHAVIASFAGFECLPNVILGAEIGGIPVLSKIDKLYVSDAAVVAVDVKTTSDLHAFSRSADALGYREQQGLIALVLEANGIPANLTQVLIAAIEKGPVPRCGVFSTGGLADAKIRVRAVLEDYAASLKSGVFQTRFESLRTL